MQLDYNENVKLPYSNSNGRYDVDGYSQILSDAIEQIDSINKISESDFLKIGDRLANYLQSSRNLSDTSGQAIASISEQILRDGITPLSGLMQEFGSYLSASSNEIRNDINNLEDISVKVENIIDEQSGFIKIVKQLKMLGISTKIESVRLGSDDQGFYSLAENVDKLSTLISDKSKTISVKASQLIQIMAVAITNLKKLESEQKVQSASIIRHTTHSMANLDDKYRQSSSKVETILNSSKQVAQNIANLVTSIQFHDITRQQMEHVKEVFADQIDILNKYSDDEINNEVPEELEVLPYTCELQSAQLKSSIDQFYSAAGGILANLREIEMTVQMILSESAGLLEDKEQSGGNSLKAIQQELVVISENLKKNAEIGNSLSESIRNVVTIVDELSGNVVEIEAIGDEIEIIALNSRVKAARTGSNGSALGVLSEAIQKLSIESKNQSVVTTGILNTISNYSGKLKESIESAAGIEKKRQIADINGKIFHLIESTIAIEEQAGLLVQKIKAMVFSLRENINSTIEGFNIHEIVKETGTAILRELSVITAACSSSSLSKEIRERSTRHYLNKYTMHSERSIHQNYTLTGQTDKSGLEEEANTSSEFDDNIELF